VPASLEVLDGGNRRVVPLTGDRCTLGKAASNDVSVETDATVSRLHAVLERYAAGWAVRDLGSRNGTFINGERIWGERSLRHGDELRIGKTRLLFRGDSADLAAATEAPMLAPELTNRERDVLVALCKPLLSGDAFSEPASVKQIADALVVTKAAVKQHLLRLYDKFHIFEGDEPRRSRLANEAIHRGAVSLADLRDPPRGV